MSSFICESCGKEILDSPSGYLTGCKHYPVDDIVKMAKELIELHELMREAVDWLPWHEPEHPDYQPGLSDIGRKIRLKLLPD